MQKLGVFWKIQDICNIMGTEIFKIEEEMTEKIKPQVANPTQKMGRILCSQYILIDPLSHSLGHYEHFEKDIFWDNLYNKMISKISYIL